jgi:hypothetical protein
MPELLNTLEWSIVPMKTIQAPGYIVNTSKVISSTFITIMAK